MISIQTKSHIGADGTLAVPVPTALRETDVEVMLIVQPMPWTKNDPDENGWPPGFFEETYGSWQGEPLERDPQGEFEGRDALL